MSLRYVRSRTDNATRSYKTTAAASATLQGAHHGRSHSSRAAGFPEDLSASFSRDSVIPRSTARGGRGTFDQKHRAMELVLADGMRENNDQNGLGLHHLILLQNRRVDP
jgi:hypothetical protein